MIAFVCALTALSLRPGDVTIFSRRTPQVYSYQREVRIKRHPAYNVTRETLGIVGTRSRKTSNARGMLPFDDTSHKT